MAASDSPPIGLSHPTVDPHVSDATSTRGACECNDCDYSVELRDGLPPKCPDCGGALTFVMP